MQLTALLSHFTTDRREDDAIRLLAHFFQTRKGALEDPALQLLLGRQPCPRVSVSRVKKALFERVPERLFDPAKQEATDLSEALSLLWPGGARSFTSTDLDTLSRPQTKPEGEATVFALLDELDHAGRELLIRLTTGRFRAPVSPSLIRAALAKARAVPVWAIEEALAADGYRSLNGLASLGAERPFTASHAYILPKGRLVLLSTGDNPAAFTLEGDPVPALPPTTEKQLALFLAWQPDGKEGRLTILDVLGWGDEDLRGKPWAARKEHLADLTDAALASSVEAGNLEALQKTLRQTPGSIALLLDGTCTLLPGTPPAWALLEPALQSFVLPVLYAEGRVPKAGPFVGELTLGASAGAEPGRNQAALLPLGKVSAKSLPEADQRAISEAVKTFTVERFGPVHRLEGPDGPVLHARVEARFETAPRRKAGIALMDAVLIELCQAPDFPPFTLEDLRKLALL